MQLTVNGERFDAADNASVADLLTQIGVEVGQIAVERNGEIVPRSSFAAALLQAGDVIEIIHFIGGG